MVKGREREHKDNLKNVYETEVNAVGEKWKTSVFFSFTPSSFCTRAIPRVHNAHPSLSPFPLSPTTSHAPSREKKKKKKHRRIVFHYTFTSPNPASDAVSHDGGARQAQDPIHRGHLVVFVSNEHELVVQPVQAPAHGVRSHARFVGVLSFEPGLTRVFLHQLARVLVHFVLRGVANQEATRVHAFALFKA